MITRSRNSAKRHSPQQLQVPGVCSREREQTRNKIRNTPFGCLLIFYLFIGITKYLKVVSDTPCITNGRPIPAKCITILSSLI